MRILLQRVTRAEVRVEGKMVGRIGAGYVALVGVARGDTEGDVAYMARKITGLRLWPDAQGKMNLALGEGAPRAVLAVSQFTLFADTEKGLRPSFDGAAPGAEAEPLFRALIERLRAAQVPVSWGQFGAHMEVELVNDGPVTVWLDSRA